MIDRQDAIDMLRSGEHLLRTDRDRIADLIERAIPVGGSAPLVMPSGTPTGRAPRPSPGFKPLPARSRYCDFRREGDEHTCGACGLRWPVDEDRPACPRATAGEPTT